MLPDMDKITPENLGDAIREVALGAAEANNVDLSLVRQPQRQPLTEAAELTEAGASPRRIAWDWLKGPTGSKKIAALTSAMAAEVKKKKAPGAPPFGFRDITDIVTAYLKGAGEPKF